jgi:hypothetical protein
MLCAIMAVRLNRTRARLPTLCHQGVYRGLQDTATPFYATLAANALNVVLGWAFIFGLGLGVKGAAAATVIAQVSAADTAWVSVSGELCLRDSANPGVVTTVAHSDCQSLQAACNRC